MAVERHLQRSAANVLHGLPGVLDHVGDELVVEVEAAGGEVEQRLAVVRFDVGGEHARRGLGGTGAYVAPIDYLHLGTAPRQLVGDGAADDAGTNDDDLRCGVHGDCSDRRV